MSLDSIKEQVADFSEDVGDRSGIMKPLLILLLVLALLLAMVGWFWDKEPEQFDVVEVTQAMATANEDPVVVGSTTTAALLEVASTLLDKRGGFLSNDIVPPGVFMDNIPHWEYGALIQVRDLSKAMRETLSRSQSQSTEDIDLADAEPRFNFDNRSWALPASESQYREGIAFLSKYMQRLSDPGKEEAQFFARADNLRFWLETVESRLGSLSQRLSASVGQRRLNTDLAGEESARQSTSAASELMVKTPWMEVDDVFFEARGTTWALIHFLRAVEVDFADVLRKKNALVSLQQIIRELEATQEPVWSPVILNGSGFGLVTNHSLVMASYISRANAALIDLRDLLARG